MKALETIAACSLVIISTVIFGSSAIHAQVAKDDSGLFIAELTSPWVIAEGKTTYNKSLAARSCLSLVDMNFSCSKNMTISYGNRFGDNWDILSLNGTRSRMIDLGTVDWADQIDIPYIEPYRELAPGEKRQITINTSGADGADGRPGANGDGTYAAYALAPNVKASAISLLKNKFLQKPDQDRASFSGIITIHISLRKKSICMPLGSSKTELTNIFCYE